MKIEEKIKDEVSKNVEEKIVPKIQSDKKDKNNKNNKNKKAIIALIIAIVCLILFIFSVIFAILNINNDNIIDGVYASTIDLSGLSKDEACEKINAQINKGLTKEITLKYGDLEMVVTAENICGSYDVNSVVEKACEIGKDSNILVNNYNILVSKIFHKELNLDLAYDNEKYESLKLDINSKLEGAVRQYDYYIEGKELKITPGKVGVAINDEEFRPLLVSIIEDNNLENNQIDIPVAEQQPETIDLSKIHSEIYKEVKDAYIVENPFSINPHVDGVDFEISMDEAKKILEEEKEEYIIPLKITPANVTTSQLGAKAFPHELGRFTTKYDASNSNRSTNMELAAAKINGKVVMPGETFSYNQTVGKRTTAAGYKMAGVYMNGKVEQGIGGGICQVSSTLYNAALYANLDIVERSNHCFVSSYVAAGRDATVSWGSLDFKFKNTRKYPIKIKASVSGGICTTTIVGMKEDTEYEVVITSSVTEYIPYTTKTIEDSSIAQGKKVVETKGASGCRSVAYRILKLNGNTVSRTLLSTDTYKSIERVERVGTKKTATTSTTPAVTPQPEPTPEPTPTPTPTPEPTPEPVVNNVTDNVIDNNI